MSFPGVLVPVLGVRLFNSTPPQSAMFSWLVHRVASPAVVLAGFVCNVVSFRDAMRHNRSVFLGVFVGVFKIVWCRLR